MYCSSPTLRLALEIVVWIYDSFGNNFGIEDDFTKYFSFKYFYKFASRQQDFIKIVQLILAALSTNGLILNTDI